MSANDGDIPLCWICPLVGNDVKKAKLSEKRFDSAVRALKSGGVVAFPTDTFFALGVDACNRNAITRAFKIKRRPDGVPMPVLISNISQAADLVGDFPLDAQLLAERFWPGALTIVLPASDRVPAELNGGVGTVGIRIPDNEVALRLISAFGGGVTGTSANMSGDPPTKDADELIAAFGDEIDVVVDGECGNESEPSTVVDMTRGRPTVVREGAISIEELGIESESGAGSA